jgi:predicted CoA-binding protein
MTVKDKTLVLGASEEPSRYSNMAIRMLRKYGFPVVAIGKKSGQVEDVAITSGTPVLEDIDTVTLYMNPMHQRPLLDWIISLSPRRIIYNPGTENPELQALATSKGIENLEACTLVMLSTGVYK